MENEKSLSGLCCLVSFLTGVLVGGGIALLVTPQSGEKTRRQLMKTAGDAKEKAEDFYDEMKDRAAGAKDKVQDYYEKAKQTVGSAADAVKKT